MTAPGGRLAVQRPAGAADPDLGASSGDPGAGFTLVVLFDRIGDEAIQQHHPLAAQVRV